jgi:hypothetical protein
MPEVIYELKIEDEERGAPIAMQVIAYDSEGENLGGVAVTLDLTDEPSNASLGSDAPVASQDVVTNPQGKFYFSVYPTAGEFQVDTINIRATWTGTDPFVFIERFSEEGYQKV